MNSVAKACGIFVAIFVLTAPGLGTWLESSMLLHVLVQLPLLVFMGWWLGELIPEDTVKKINAWNYSGLTGVLLISGTGLFWMLPSALDESLGSIDFLIAKVISMVFLIGITLSITSKAWHPILKGVFLLEVWAMLGRFGYGYMVSPDRLCANYLFNEQQLLGEALLWIAAIWAIVWSLKIILGFDLIRMKVTGW